jgi:hypothetical protein
VCPAAFSTASISRRDSASQTKSIPRYEHARRPALDIPFGPGPPQVTPDDA